MLLFCLKHALFYITKGSDNELYFTSWTPNSLQICKWEATMLQKSLEILTSVWMKQPFHNPVDLKHSRHWNLFSTRGGFLNMLNYCLSPSCFLNMASVIQGSLLWHRWHIKIIVITRLNDHLKSWVQIWIVPYWKPLLELKRSKWTY